jgi:thioredoxin 2
VPRCGACHNLLPWLVEANADSFEAELQASVPVLVDLWAPWCAPCKPIAAAVEQLAKAHAGQLKVVKLDIDSAPDIAARYDVRGIPALLLVRDGNEVDRHVGAASARQLEPWLERHLGAHADAPA